MLLALAAAPSILAVAELGRLHADEVYQTLEPAYFRAHGYGILAWEWFSGIRNWAIPGLFSWLLRLCDTMGIQHPLGYRAVLEIPQYLLHAWMLAAVYRYAARRVNPREAMLAMALVAVYGPVLVFAGRTIGESFSTPFLVIGLEYLDRSPQGGRHALVAGLMMGLAVVARYGSLAIVGAVLIWLVAFRRWGAWACAVAALALVTAGLGALDAATWGRPFHSLIAYSRFNVLSGEAARQFGSAPATYYLPVVAAAIPIWFWLALPTAWRSEPTRPSCALFAAIAYLGALSVTAHKEERFVYPALVWIAMAAAPWIVLTLRRVGRPDLRSSLASLLLFCSFGPYVYSLGLHAERSDEFRAVVKAARPASVQGLLILGDGLWGSPGYFYIGKNIPWLNADSPTEPRFHQAMLDARFNRVVTYDDIALPELKAAGFELLERVGRAAILARR